MSKIRGAVISNEEQLWLMQQVKQNLMTIEEAVSWTEERENELRAMGDDVIPKANIEKTVVTKTKTNTARKRFISMLHRKGPKPVVAGRRKSSGADLADSITPNDLRNKQIYNFSVYKYGKHKNSQKRIFQIDFKSKTFSFIQNGNILSTTPFSSLVDVNGQEGKKLFIYQDDRQEVEINAENLADKTKLMRLLNIVNEQNEHEEKGKPFDPCKKLEESFKIIKEGEIEKKGNYTASHWPRRLVVIRPGELAYYRVDEEELSAALNIIHLAPGSVEITAEENNIFVVATTKESHRFRVPEGHSNPSIIRDKWIEAVHKGCSRNYESKNQVIIKTLKDTLVSESEDVNNNFNFLYQEVKKLKEGLIFGGIDQNLVESHLEKFLSAIKTLESNAKSPDRLDLNQAKETDKFRRHSKVSTNTAYTIDSKCSSKSDITTNSLTTSLNQSKTFNGSGQHRLIQDENVYEPVHTENIYAVASEISSSVSIRVSSNDDISDDEKISNFPVILPSPTNQQPEISTSDSQKKVGLSLLPLPSPNVYNGNAIRSENEISTSFCEKLPVVTTNKDNEYSFADAAVPGINITNNNQIVNLSIDEEPVVSLETNSLLPLPPPDVLFIPDPVASKTVNSSVVTPLAHIPPPPPIEIPFAPPPPAISFAPTPPGVPLAPPPPIGKPPLSSPNVSPSKSSRKGKIALRPFHWVPVPKQMINKSMWKNAPDLLPYVNIEELNEMFKSNDKKQDNEELLKKGTEMNGKKKQLESYLDRKTAQNLGIFLAGFKLRGDELVRKLSVVDEEKGGISTEHLNALLKFAPEPELKTLYEKHAGKENEELAKEDRFIAELSRIPRLSLRLETLQIVRDLPNVIENLQPEIDLVLKSCFELMNSKSFESLLYFILTVLNCINSTNNKGTTRGIRLSTLQKMTVMRTNDKKQNLLQVVIKIVKKSQPEILSVHNELTSLAKSKTYSIKGLLAELDIMRKSSFKARKNCDMLRRKKNQPTKEDLLFCNDIEVELGKIDATINKLGEKCIEIRQMVSKVLVQFGEASDTDSQDLFKWVGEFLEELRKINNN